MGAKAGQRRKAGAGLSGRQRLGLILFGAVFVLLFVGFAIAQGIGAPSVPSGDVALVQGVPGDVGEISEEDFERALEQQAGQAKLKTTPKPGSAKYEELKKTAMNELLNEAWLQGQAEELGITVTDKQVDTELAKIRKESFPTKAAWQKFLAESHFTPKEVKERVRLQQLGTQIQQRVSSEGPKPTKEQIAAYYEAEKATKFTVKASRNARVIVNEKKSQVEAAKKALEKDNSPAGWKKAVGKYSSNPALKAKGGLQENITEEFLKEPLKKAIFGSATNELVGPVHYENNYFLVEVVKLNPAKTKTLKEAESEISTTLGQEQQQEFFTEFVAGYRAKWQSRTTCASGYLTEECGNYKGNGHPTTAPAACYEANPKTPATECPAPVTQTQPALPGTVTPLKKKGEPFVQRPQPEPPPPPTGAAPTGGAETPPPPPPAEGGGSEAGSSEGGAGKPKPSGK